MWRMHRKANGIFAKQGLTEVRRHRGECMGLTDFGKVVKKKLIDKDMTQAQLAAMIGCGNQYLHKILVGERSGDKYKEEISVILEIDLVA